MIWPSAGLAFDAPHTHQGNLGIDFVVCIQFA